MNARRRGYSLTELLIVIVLGGIALALFSATFQNMLRNNASRRAARDEKTRDIAALERFSEDARRCRSVLELDPERIEFWLDDANGNRGPDDDERVLYEWRGSSSGTGGDWVRTDDRGSVTLCEAREIFVGGDTDPPATRHIVIRLLIGSDSRLIGTSVALRNEIRD